MCNLELKQLIEDFRHEDMTAFGFIYEEFKRFINLYSRRLDYEDATQELTIFLIELLYDIDLSKFPSSDSDGLMRYIAVSLRNKYIVLSKENYKYKSMSAEIYESEVFSCDTLDERLNIEEALKALTNRQRLVIIYKYIFDYSDAEISNILGISRQAVNQNKNRAFITLRKFYKL